jgi:hypothetical protein
MCESEQQSRCTKYSSENEVRTVETKQTINNSCTTLLMDQSIEQERSLGKKMTWERGKCVNQNHEAGAPNTGEP